MTSIKTYRKGKKNSVLFGKRNVTKVSDGFPKISEHSLLLFGINVDKLFFNYTKILVSINLTIVIRITNS